MTPNSSEMARVRLSRVFTHGGRYAGATLLTLVSGACIIGSFQQAHWWASILCVVAGLSLPLGIARIIPNERQDRDQELHRSYWSRVGFSYVYVVVIAVGLILILPLLGMALLDLLDRFGFVMN